MLIKEKKCVHRTIHLTVKEDKIVREVAKFASVSVNRVISCAISNPEEYAYFVKSMNVGMKNLSLLQEERK